jgi:hypothetical protein
MALNITDTRHLTGGRPPKLQIDPSTLYGEWDDALNEAEIRRQTNVYDRNGANILPSDEVSSEALKTGKNEASKFELPYQLAQIENSIAEAQRLIDANKPQYDEERERRLRRIGRAQKYTDAFTVLAQAIGGLAGASVPQMQLNNSVDTVAAIRRLRDVHEDQERRYQLLGLQELLRGLELKRATVQRDADRAYESSEYDRRQDIAARRERERIADQQAKELAMLNERERIANDPQSLANRRADAMTNAQIQYYNAGTQSRGAYANYQQARADQGRHGDDNRAYLHLYDSPASTKPTRTITEGMAYKMYEAIMSDPNIKSSELDMLRLSYELGEPPTPAQIKSVVSRHWQLVSSMLQQEDKPVANQSQYQLRNQNGNQTSNQNDNQNTQQSPKGAINADVLKRIGIDAEAAARTYPDKETRNRYMRSRLIYEYGLSREQADAIIDRLYN